MSEFQASLLDLHNETLSENNRLTTWHSCELLRLSINVILCFLFTALSLVINSAVMKLSSVGILPANVSVHWCALGPAGSQKEMSDPMELSYGWL